MRAQTGKKSGSLLLVKSTVGKGDAFFSGLVNSFAYKSRPFEKKQVWLFVVFPPPPPFFSGLWLSFASVTFSQHGRTCQDSRRHHRTYVSIHISEYVYRYTCVGVYMWVCRYFVYSVLWTVPVYRKSLALRLSGVYPRLQIIESSPCHVQTASCRQSSDSHT